MCIRDRYPPEWMKDLLQSSDRKLAAPTFSSQGLYLAKVSYPHQWGLPEIPRMPLVDEMLYNCLLYTSPSPRDRTRSRMPSSA